MTAWTQKLAVTNNLTRSQLFILLVAFLVKAAVLLVALPALTDLLSSQYAVGFADDYDRLANNLVQGNGYRIEPGMTETMMREPGYPLFLAAVFKLGGYHIEAARVANLLLAVGIAIMVIRLTRRVTDDELTATIAALLFLFHPGTLVAEARGGVEIAFIFAVMIFMLGLHAAVEKGDIWRYFIAGVALGFVVQIRSTPLFFPMFLLAYLLFIREKRREPLRLLSNLLVLVFGMAIVMSPWVIRNYALVHEFIPTATIQGIAAQEGQYTCKHMSFDRGFQQLQAESADERNRAANELGVPFRAGYFQYFFSPKDEVEYNRKLLQKVAAEYRDDPKLLARCVARNIVNFWFLGKTWQATFQNVLVQLPVMLLALGGVYVFVKRGRLRVAGLMLTFVIYVMTVHLPIIAHTRHSIPLVPFLAILASVAMVSTWRWHRAKVSNQVWLDP